MNSTAQRTQRQEAWGAAGLALLTVVLTLLGAPMVTLAQWATSGNDIYNSNSGNVGIGTTGPGAKLHLYDAAVPGQPPLFIERGYDGARVRLSYAFANTHGEIGMVTGPGNFTSTDSDLWMGVNLNSTGASHVVSPTQSNSSASSWITRWNGRAGDNFSISRIAPGGGDNASTFLYINGSGNIGIGTSYPTTKLYVVGDVTVTGNIAAKYQDVAEWVPARRQLSPGTVVVLDVKESNRVLPSTQAYDIRVAGVVSDTPGLLLGEAGEGKVKVATTGRVKAKVDATRKPIEMGDLLVTSDQVGLAMRSDPLDLAGVPIHRPGTIIGKALEPLSGGQGEILVLLSLQ